MVGLAVSIRSALALLSLAIASCGPVNFHVVANGASERIVGSHSTHALRGATRIVTVCGDYARSLFATDTGGSICVEFEFDRAAIASLSVPITLLIAGHAQIDMASQHVSFTPDPESAPAVSSIALAWHDCLCANFSRQSIHGTITLTQVTATRLAGAIEVTIEQSNRAGDRPYVDVVRARFDASGP